MANVLSQAIRVARKSYNCCGAEQIQAIGSLEDYPAPKCKKIEKGDRHFVQNISDGGSVYAWRSCKACLAYIQEHELYED